MADQEGKAGLLLFLSPNDIIQAVTKKRAAGLPSFKMKKKSQKSQHQPKHIHVAVSSCPLPGSRDVVYKNRHTRSRNRRCLIQLSSLSTDLCPSLALPTVAGLGTQHGLLLAIFTPFHVCLVHITEPGSGMMRVSPRHSHQAAVFSLWGQGVWS